MIHPMRLVDLLLPPACAGCGRPGSLVCARCADAARPAADAGNRFLAPDPGAVVGETLALAMAAYAYEGPMRRALAALKYTGVSRLAPIVAAQAAPQLRELLAISGPATLVPVPLHRDRLRERGYNQAALLADALGRGVGVGVDEALARARPTTKQHRLNRAARLQNLRGAFVAVHRPPAAVILVDDIITTTATLEACAAVLMVAGCEAVYGFGIAREI